jgi:hypothetical protein
MFIIEAITKECAEFTLRHWTQVHIYLYMNYWETLVIPNNVSTFFSAIMAEWKIESSVITIIISSLYEAHKMNAQSGDRACSVIRVFRIRNYSTDFDEIWYGGDVH